MKMTFYKLNILLIIFVFFNSCTQEDIAPNLLVGWREETLGKVQFTNLTENADSFLWEFDDKTTSTEKTPVKIYTQNGDYQVKVTATTGKKAKSQTLKIKVKSVVLEVFEFNRNFHNFYLDVGLYSNPEPLKLPLYGALGGKLVYCINNIKFAFDSPSYILIGTTFSGPDPIFKFSGFTPENIKEIIKVNVQDNTVYEYKLTFDKPFEISVSRVDKGNIAVRLNRDGDDQLCKSVLFKGQSINFDGNFGKDVFDANFFKYIVDYTPKKVEDNKNNLIIVMRGPDDK